MSFFKRKHRKTLSEMGREFALTVPPPKPKRFLTALRLLEQTEMWYAAGDKELEIKAWQTLSEQAKKYSENINIDDKQIIESKCGYNEIVRPCTNTVIEL